MKEKLDKISYWNKKRKNVTWKVQNLKKQSKNAKAQESKIVGKL